MNISLSAIRLSEPASEGRAAAGGCASGYTLHVVRVFDEMGLDGSGLAREAGIARADLGAPGGRIGQEQVTRLWRLAAARSGDEALGISVAREIRPDAMALLGYSLMLSPTLDEAYRRAARDLHLLGDLFRIEITVEGLTTHMTLWMRESEQIPTEAADSVPAVILTTGRRLTGEAGLSPARIELTRPAPHDRLPFEDFYQCPIRYAAPHNRLVFRNADLQRPVASAHAGLAEIYDRFVQSRYPDPGATPFSAGVRRHLTALFPDGAPTVETLARQLGVSARTLHRRLAVEGTSFRAMVEATRKALAAEFLEQGRALKQVSAHLGFSEPANFTRAFKRWYGVTPGEYRKARLAARANLVTNP